MKFENFAILKFLKKVNQTFLGNGTHPTASPSTVPHVAKIAGRRQNQKRKF